MFVFSYPTTPRSCICIAPRTQEFLFKQQECTEVYMSPTKAFQMQLVKEIAAVDATTSNGTQDRESSQTSAQTVWRGPPERPSQSSPWQYYTKTVSGKEMNIYCRRPFCRGNKSAAAGMDREQELLDPNDLIGTNLFFSIGSIALSFDATEKKYCGDTEL